MCVAVCLLYVEVSITALHANASIYIWVEDGLQHFKFSHEIETQLNNLS